MKLVVFDLDGTLVHHSRMDSGCFVRAFVEEFGISNIDPSWVNPAIATDSGYAKTVFVRCLHRQSESYEISQIREKYVWHLTELLQSNSISFSAVTGAANIINLISTHSDWCAAIATGCWRDSALIKLEKSGLCVGDMPIVTSDMEIKRSSIVSNCISLAKQTYRVTEFQRIVMVGDAYWDVITAASLQLPFICVQQDKLQEISGNFARIDNFSDSDLFFKLLDSAVVPVITT